MIRRAFEVISDIPTRLICFSDDMDGMRKVPGNVPNQDRLREDLQRPLTAVYDPFETHESFGHHNNAMLRRFLDTFGFEYEFYSATEFYKSGQFDEVLKLACERYDAVMKVMLKSLREERQQTYSIFLPIHPETGRVLVFDSDMDMHAKNEVSLSQFLQILSYIHIALKWRDFLLHPRRKRMRACSKDFEVFFSSKVDDRSPKPYNLFTDLGWCMTNAASHFEHRLMQFWLNIFDRDTAIF